MINMDQKLARLKENINIRFKGGLKSVPRFDEKLIAIVVTSNSEIETYPMTMFMDTIRKWVGPRQIGKLAVEKLSVTNDDYEATIVIPVNDIERDKIGIYGDVAQGKGQQCRALWGNIAVEALLINDKWLDGKLFFLADRKFNKNEICNVTTDELSVDTFDTGYDIMCSYVGYDGEGLGVVPNILMVGPSNRKMAFTILENQRAVQAGDTSDVAVDNHNKGLCQIVINKKLVGAHAKKWFLMDTTQIVKPVVVQKEKEGALIAMDKPTDPNVFFGTTNGKDAVPGGVVVYGAHYKGAAAKTLPHLIYGGLATV